MPAQEPAGSRPPVEASPAPSHSAEVVQLEERRIPPCVPWPPIIPYVGMMLIGAALTTAAVHVACDVALASGRMSAVAFEMWSGA